NPARTHAVDVPAGRAHVFFPEATPERCTAALLVEVDAVGLVRGARQADDAPLAQYVNDRPYAASSFLSVALSRVFQTALAGRSRERQALADAAIPLSATLHAVPCRGGEAVVRRLFEPLGYEVTAEALPLDPAFPAWGPSRLHDLTLVRTGRLAELLTHLYVLVPVLDDHKHYWVGPDEVDKLLARGEGWLGEHPERELIVERALKHRGALVRDALDRLRDDDGVDDAPDHEAGGEEALERPLSLNEQRLDAVVEALRAAGAATVADLGCGEGKLLARLVRDAQFTRVLGIDVSVRALERARRRLDPERLPARVAERLTLAQGSATYRDARLGDVDAICLVEVIEHVELDRLPAVEQAVFAAAQPRVVVVTTPNAEYNVRFDGLAAGALRHTDHRFEWTRAELEGWAGAVAARHGYRVRFAPIGPVDPEVGAPTQLAVFER
ncbi:MAG: 3' terminal RNA ribose 2'-O-methyltransferase Hen1, partial [Myxococcota bacterium]